MKVKVAQLPEMWGGCWYRIISLQCRSEHINGFYFLADFLWGNFHSREEVAVNQQLLHLPLPQTVAVFCALAAFLMVFPLLLYLLFSRYFMFVIIFFFVVAT